METQQKRCKIKNKLTYMRSRLQGADKEELIYLFDDSIKDEGDIYEILIGAHPYQVKPIKVKNIKELEEAKARGEKHIDCSRINVEKESIEGKNLENCNLNIELKKLYIPKERKQPKFPEDELFIFLNKTNLKGNHIIGNLEPVQYNGYSIYFSYSEDTFDKTFKQEHPEYFLSKKAPHNLKRDYYEAHYYTLIKENGDYFCFFERSTLDFAKYLKYYEFLKGKYLGNFKMDPKELLKIQFVETYGIEEAKKVLENLANSPLSFYAEIRGKMEAKGNLYDPFPNHWELSPNQEREQMYLLLQKYQNRKITNK